MVEAGWQASDLASPILTSRLNSFERVVKMPCRPQARRDAEGQERTSAAAEIFPRQRVVGIVGKARVIDPCDARIAAQEFGDAPRILDVALDAQRHRLDALQQQERDNGASTAPVVR